MTEISDLGAFLAQAAQPRPPDEHQLAVIDAEKREMLARIALVAKFAAILCDCKPWFDRWDSTPPQVNCSVHGVLMTHPYTGAVIMAGMPGTLDVFTPPRNDEGTAHDRNAHRGKPAAG